MTKKTSGSENTYAEIAADDQVREARYQEFTDNRPVRAIVIDEAPISIRDFIPNYRYRFDGEKSQSGDLFVEELTKFIEANQYLLMDDRPSRAFAQGFARAMAVAALYMDSLELNADALPDQGTGRMPAAE